MLNFIVNTNSGKGKGIKTLRKIIDYCHSNKVEYTVHATASPTHAERIAKTLCLNGADTIVAVGGDGTFHEVVNGVNGFENVAVGFIPSGRGNDYARIAKLSLDPTKALDDIVRGEIVRTDILSIGNRRCLNAAGTGLDVDVLQRVEGNAGKLTYLLSLMYCIKHFNPYKISVTNEGKTDEYEAIMVAACNGMYIGGGMKVSPLSDIFDGKMNVLVVLLPEDGKIMKALRGFLRGKHIDKPYVRHFLCDEVKIEGKDDYKVQLDGEIYEDLCLDCKLIKGGLKTFRPAKK